MTIATMTDEFLLDPLRMAAMWQVCQAGVWTMFRFLQHCADLNDPARHANQVFSSLVEAGFGPRYARAAADQAKGVDHTTRLEHARTLVEVVQP